MRAKVRLKALRIPNPCEIIRTRARSEAIGTPLQQMDPHERLGPNQSAKIEAECLTTAQSTAKMQVRSGSKSLSVERGASVTGVESVCRGSNWFCKNYAYAIEVRAHLQRLENDGKTNIVAVDLSELYLKRAGAVAEQQATRAGWRLAEILKTN